MAIGMGDITAILLLAGFAALAWWRKNAGGETWAFRIIPFGIMLMMLVRDLSEVCWLLLALTFVAYAIAAYRGGWRLKSPRNCILRRVWWMTHIIVYFMAISIFCGISASILRAAVRFSPIAVESDWPWTKGKITDDLPFAVEYKRAKTLCAEYYKRLLFKSGKRVGLLIDPCGYGPFRVYRLADGNYCLVDGYGMIDNQRYLRVNAKLETVELKVDGKWHAIPEKGYVRGWGGSDDCFFFDMYSGGDFNGEGWHVQANGTPVGNSLDGMELIGEINTRGKFKSVSRSAAKLQDNGKGENDILVVRIAEIEVHPEWLEAYLAAAGTVGAESVAKEPGVVCIFPMQKKESPTSIRIVEIYRSEEAYKAHLATPHFRKYKEGTPHMIKSLELVPMRPLDEDGMKQIFEKQD